MPLDFKQRNSLQNIHEVKTAYSQHPQKIFRVYDADNAGAIYSEHPSQAVSNIAKENVIGGKFAA